MHLSKNLYCIFKYTENSEILHFLSGIIKWLFAYSKIKMQGVVVNTAINHELQNTKLG